jgi:hypothetical protein
MLPRVLCTAFEDATSDTMLNHSRKPEYLGSDCGITIILHTWGQQLDFYPHVHCIVSGGGFDGENWEGAKRKSNNFLFPETSMSTMYKAFFFFKS